MELGLMIAKTRPILGQFDLHLRPISARFNQECHSPTKSCKGGCGGWGRLRRPRRSPQSPGPTPHGRRQRPHPPSPPPPPPPPPLLGRLLPPQNTYPCKFGLAPHQTTIHWALRCAPIVLRQATLDG